MMIPDHQVELIYNFDRDDWKRQAYPKQAFKLIINISYNCDVKIFLNRPYISIICFHRSLLSIRLHFGF